jgi:hypothetical protein
MLRKSLIVGLVAVLVGCANTGLGFAAMPTVSSTSIETARPGMVAVPVHWRYFVGPRFFYRPYFYRPYYYHPYYYSPSYYPYYYPYYRPFFGFRYFGPHFGIGITF